MEFTLQATDVASSARAGTITTDRGVIETPIFMPVGTVGSVKAVTIPQLKEEVRAQIILGNTYHLYLRPGMETMEAAGGLHRFAGWDRPMLTDSGGYQVFSLSEQRKITEDGVVFRSHIDGSKHLFTPERVMDIQRTIGADIIMAFDECPPYPCDEPYAKHSMELTHRWLARCKQRLAETEPKWGAHQSLFPIVQGSNYKNLRKESCQMAASMECDGNAIGGLSVGEPEEMMYEMAAWCCEHLPAEKPRYLMGVGTPWNILENISLGVDMFDCVMPTRNGRNGMMFTTQGVVNIKNAKWARDFSPLDDGLDTFTSNHYTKAYVRHLFAAGEYLGLTIASVHNLSFYLHLVREARKHILAGDFDAWKREMIPILKRRL
jgi:queuine tRNA-ribosyltransferase